MARAQPSHAVALGLRVKTGKAAAIVLAADGGSPRALVRRSLELYDRRIPHSWQPYHAALERNEEEGRQIVERATRSAYEVAGRAVSEIMEEQRRANREVRALGIVVGSRVDPATVTNAHMRAHAAEGRLYWQAVLREGEAHGLHAKMLVERDLYDEASKILGRPADELKRIATELGRTLGRPWRADEKTASIAAWVALQMIPRQRS